MLSDEQRGCRMDPCYSWVRALEIHMCSHATEIVKEKP